METVPVKLLTIIAEALLEVRLVNEIKGLGARGYSVSEVRGEGSRGIRASEWEGKERDDNHYEYDCFLSL